MLFSTQKCINPIWNICKLNNYEQLNIYMNYTCKYFYNITATSVAQCDKYERSLSAKSKRASTIWDWPQYLHCIYLCYWWRCKQTEGEFCGFHNKKSPKHGIKCWKCINIAPNNNLKWKINESFGNSHAALILADPHVNYLRLFFFMEVQVPSMDNLGGIINNTGQTTNNTGTNSKFSYPSRWKYISIKLTKSCWSKCGGRLPFLVEVLWPFSMIQNNWNIISGSMKIEHTL